MKKNIFIAFLILVSVKAFSQENMVTFSGGWASANIEDTDSKGTGYRINGSYEFNPTGTKFAHGISFGYVHLTATGTGSLSGTSTINSFPIYYAPKYIFGENKIKLFIKGALGTQYASLKYTGTRSNSVSGSDFGFYGGGGAGLMYFIKDNIFLNGEYEIAWASNNYYKDGWISSATIGLGFKF